MKEQQSRRDFIRNAVYVAPTILTIDVVLAEASTGSSLPSREFGASPFVRDLGRGDGSPIGHEGPFSPHWSAFERFFARLLQFLFPR